MYNGPVFYGGLSFAPHQRYAALDGKTVSIGAGAGRTWRGTSDNTLRGTPAFVSLELSSFRPGTVKKALLIARQRGQKTRYAELEIATRPAFDQAGTRGQREPQSTQTRATGVFDSNVLRSLAARRFEIRVKTDTGWHSLGYTTIPGL
jgi:hypothetical protein